MLPLIFAITDGRRATLVKNSPVTSAFDISWVDNSTQKYYLADRTNNAIDLVDAATDTFVGFIGKGHYTGSMPCPGHARDAKFGTTQPQVPTTSRTA